MTNRQSWGISRVTSSAQCKLKTAPCHTKRASLESWLKTAIFFAIAIGIASGEVATEQCSAANCLNYTGTSKVSFISLFP